MAKESAGNPRRACLQQLQADRFLGAKAIPFDPDKVPHPKAPTPGDSESTPIDVENKAQALKQLQAQVTNCQQCPLSQTRTNTVFGQGNPNARLVFVGEAPGFHEDQQGLPFVGRAGKLLDDILTKGMGLTRDDVYICNVLKCRPPQNRDPGSAEMVCCQDFQEQQLKIIAPEVICCLGRIASQALLQTKNPMRELRGNWHDYMGIKTMVTYHPAYLLRNPADKAKSWADIQKVMAELGINRPKR